MATYLIQNFFDDLFFPTCVVLQVKRILFFFFSHQTLRERQQQAKKIPGISEKITLIYILICFCKLFKINILDINLYRKKKKKKPILFSQVLQIYKNNDTKCWNWNWICDCIFFCYLKSLSHLKTVLCKLQHFILIILLKEGQCFAFIDCNLQFHLFAGIFCLLIVRCMIWVIVERTKMDTNVGLNP